MGNKLGVQQLEWINERAHEGSFGSDFSDSRPVVNWILFQNLLEGEKSLHIRKAAVKWTQRRLFVIVSVINNLLQLSQKLLILCQKKISRTLEKHHSNTHVRDRTLSKEILGGTCWSWLGTEWHPQVLSHPSEWYRPAPAWLQVGTVDMVLLYSLPAASGDESDMSLWQLIRSDSPDVWPEYKAGGEKNKHTFIKPSGSHLNMCVWSSFPLNGFSERSISTFCKPPKHFWLK